MLVLTVFALIQSSPALNLVVKDNFALLVEKAEDWLTAITEGLAVTKPTDPDTGHTVGIAWGSETFVDLDTE